MKQTTHVLVADDEEIYTQLIKTVLREAGGYDVATAESGEETIELLKSGPFDVVILDYLMPQGSGLNVLQWMLEQKADTPVIMLTAAGSEGIAVEAMKLGAYDYMRKDQIDPRHIPIVINGVRERYLFRKEKERESKKSTQFGHSRQLFETIQKTVLTLSNSLTSGLSVARLDLQQIETTLQILSPPESSEELHQTFKEIKGEYELIESLSRSMNNLVQVMFDRLVGSLNDDTARREVERETTKALTQNGS